MSRATPAPETKYDLASVDELINALYAAISFKQGELPKLNLLRTLLIPRALLISTTADRPTILTPDEFIGRFEAQIESGAVLAFEEKEIARRTERYGKVMHLTSAYQTELTSPSGEVVMRGVNSIQLFWDRDRYFVASIVWDNETEANPLTDEITTSE